MHPDLLVTTRDVVLGRRRAAALLDASLDAAQGPANRHTFIRLFADSARSQAVRVDALQAAGQPVPRLAGLAVSVKDLFDVEDQPTSAGSRVLEHAAPAAGDAACVARLRAAGAALIGHTNLSEFAFSGVGLNPHHGTPVNAATSRLDAEPRIPGGSTSGGAVSVATGAAYAALGSDTGGSIRIPAALQGLVGFKSTARLTPTTGCVPLSTTLDTACAITRSVRDAVLMHEVLAAREVVHGGRPLHALRLALVTTSLLDGMDPVVSRAFERCVSALRRAGAHIDEIALPELAELPVLLHATGGFSAVESWAWHRTRLATQQALYDPRVVARIRRGEAVSAADYIDLINARRAWIERTTLALQGFDAVISPTVPIVAPPIAALERDDTAFFAVNAQLLRNPSTVNFLDGCALSLPIQAADELPVGLMAWSTALADDRVLEVSLAIESALAAAAR